MMSKNTDKRQVDKVECLRYEIISIFLNLPPKIIREQLGKFGISCSLFSNPAEISKSRRRFRKFPRKSLKAGKFRSGKFDAQALY